jgi:hypothetical protein
MRGVVGEDEVRNKAACRDVVFSITLFQVRLTRWAEIRRSLIGRSESIWDRSLGDVKTVCMAFFLSRPCLVCPREEFEIGWIEYWNIENWFEKRVSNDEVRPFMKFLMLQEAGLA